MQKNSPFRLWKAKKDQTPVEEKWNTITHFAGTIMACVGLILLWIKSLRSDFNWVTLFSVSLYGLALILLYFSSTRYHLNKNPDKKKVLRQWDHASIYVLIAGTYTPIALLVLKGTVGYTLFALEWGIALFGIAFKLFFMGRFEKFSLFLYLVMGWLVVFEWGTLQGALNEKALQMLVWGGIAYTVGAVFYATKRLVFSHVIWHVFVLAGSFFHFLMVYHSIPG
jgi:hemolysin III